MDKAKIGIIGLGSRGVNSLGRTIARLCGETGFRITALCDRNVERMNEVKPRLVQAFAEQGVDIDPKLYQNGLELIDDPEVDLIMITSITDTHRQFAVPALLSGKKVYCDKPLAHDAQNAVAIVDAETQANNPLIMGFTRRYELPWRRAYDLLQAGTIGDLLMIQVRNIIPYHRYLTAWWRRRAWSGGALSDKGSHLFDVFNWFAGSRPVKVNGLGSRSVLTPDPSAPQRCSVCDRECPYRRRPQGDDGLGSKRHYGRSWMQEQEEKYMDDVCAYAPGSDLYHNGNIHFAYQNGVIAAYFYSIFGPHAEDQETLELVGTTGRIILTRHTGMLDVVADRGNDHRVIDCRAEHFGGSHFGADMELVRELRRFYDGAPPTVSARNGLEATRMVMAAFRSMDNGGATVSMADIPDSTATLSPA